MSKNISFIHLSDIHFNKFSGDRYDIDEDLRSELLRDIRENAKKIIFKPKGILVCGDIAFSGKFNEYENAKKFLQDICEILEIHDTPVFCVPGNHDVDQEVPKNSQGFLDIQSEIEVASDSDERLHGYLRDSLFKSALFHHIHEYNKFAGKYSCNINADNPYWQESFTLNDGSELNLVGLNSIVISSHLDNDKRLMVLGQYQIPKRKDGVVYVCLCHHPPDCWKDSDAIENKLKERVCVQLYGHKHIQKVKKINNSLVIGSGATHPPRSAKEWRPRYNWLSFCVESADNDRQLKVSIYPRVLDDDNDRFIPDSNSCNGNDPIEYSLNLDKWEGNRMKPSEEINTSKESLINANGEKVPSKTIRNPKRTLVYRFLELSFISRFRILDELNLISEEDEGAEHVNLLDKILQKAMENKCLDAMWEKVNDAHNDGVYKNNPFKNVP